MFKQPHRSVQPQALDEILENPGPRQSQNVTNTQKAGSVASQQALQKRRAPGVSQKAKNVAASAGTGGSQISLPRVSDAPPVHGNAPVPPVEGAFPITDAQQNIIGYFVPASPNVVGGAQVASPIGHFMPFQAAGQSA